MGADASSLEVPGMLIKDGICQIVVAALSCALCACGAETAAPTSRGGNRGQASGSGTITPNTSSVMTGVTGMAGMNTALAGSGSPVIQPSTKTTAPRVGTGDPNVCEIVQLVANPQVPDMMIVLDRSGSMQDGGRWQPSVAAVRKITNQLQSRIRFGLTLFPEDSSVNIMSSTMNGGFQISFSSGESCAPGKIVVPIAPMNASAISMELDKTRPNGGTPTSDTLMKLVDAFATMDATPDAQQHPKYVLLVTDGAPTCPTGMGADTNQADIDASNKAVEALTDRMVKTYVIGYDTNTPGNEKLAQVLDGFAQRGGTGDQKHRPVEDETSLTMALESIASTIATCSFQLDKAPPRADYVLVTLDGKQVNLNDANGWRMADDRTVELVGDACTTFKSGAHLLNAEVQCMVVQPS